ncbi:MAG: T9SS type A sorting domain-containing protein, partial [Flavobacteriales bacterium]
MKRSLHTLALGLVLPLGLCAQSAVDVGIYNNQDGQVEVRLRPEENFSGILSSIVFSLRWDKSSGASLGDVVQTDAMSNAITVHPSGPVRENGNHFYQVFAGFSFSPLSTNDLALEAGHEFTVMMVPVSGKAQIELVNDAWTGELANNGDYYVSLGGDDRTGVIYKDLASAADVDGTVLIQPNPNNGLFSFQFTVNDKTDVQVEIMNTLGQVTFTDRLNAFVGVYRKEMDLTSQSNGIYYLK